MMFRIYRLVVLFHRPVFILGFSVSPLVENCMIFLKDSLPILSSTMDMMIYI